MVEKFCGDSRPLRNVSGEKIIPTFDPDNYDTNIKNWLAKIDQLGMVHKWDDYSKIVIMQTRLVGQAQLWFSRLDEYNYTWDQWKSLLIKAFPRSFEYADMFEELVPRKKLYDETMTHYYHDKLAMCHRCRLDDAASLSCLIKGLPNDLQNNAKAFKCETPEQFYSGYLSSFENYKNKPDLRKVESTNISYTRNNRLEAEKRNSDLAIPTTSRPWPPSTSRRMNCFRCNSTEHMVKDCPVPDRRVCRFCSETGHNINRCPKIENMMNKSKGQSVSINLVQNLNDIYKKSVEVAGRIFSGYLDTGAQLNVISLSAIKILNYDVRPTDAILKGFTGNTVPAMGRINLTMIIDGLSFNTTAVVTHMKLPAEVDILIGQPVINSEGISLVTTQNSPILKENNVYDDSFSGKYKVISCSDIQIQPQESIFVEVNIVGNSTACDVCTSPRVHDLNNKYFAVPAALLTGQNGYLRIYNMGQEQLKWRKGDLVTRAAPCEIMQNESAEKRVGGSDNAKLHANKMKDDRCYESLLESLEQCRAGWRRQGAPKHDTKYPSVSVCDGSCENNNLSVESIK